MNLIEQFDEYLEFKRILRMSMIKGDYDGGVLAKELLKYRREHGIFEVGDKVVCIYGQDSTFLTQDEVYTIKEVCYGGTHITLKLQENYDGGDSSYSVNRFIHATDEEIKSNKRIG